jgi:hypothetical protein
MLGFATEISQENPGIGVDPTSLPKPREDETFKDYTTKTIPEWLAQNKPLIAAYNNFQDPESIQRFQTKLMSSQFASKELVDNIEKIRNEKAAQEAAQGLGAVQAMSPNYQTFRTGAQQMAGKARSMWGATQTPEVAKAPEYQQAQGVYAQQAVPTLAVPGQTSVGAMTQLYQQGQGGNPPAEAVAKMYPTAYQAGQLEAAKVRNETQKQIAAMRARVTQSMQQGADETKQLAIYNDAIHDNDQLLTARMKDHAAIVKAIAKPEERASLLVELGLSATTSDSDLRALEDQYELSVMDLKSYGEELASNKKYWTKGYGAREAARKSREDKEKEQSAEAKNVVNAAPYVASPMAYQRATQGTIMAPVAIPPRVTPSPTTTTSSSSYLEEVRRRRQMGQ